MGLQVAFDIGGTFTDFVLVDEATGDSRYLKTLTTHEDLTIGVVAGIDRLLAAAGASLGDVVEILHATTVAANAVLERRGGRTGLLTTAGFRDVLQVGRQKRHDLYDLAQKIPTPLVPRRMVAELSERIDAQGNVVEALTNSSITDALAHLEQVHGSVDAIAVSLLHAYVNPEHEEQVRNHLMNDRPELPVSISSEVAPRRGEYERTSTVVADAYVKPIVWSYLIELRRALEARGFTGQLLLMQSNGGLTEPNVVARHPIRIVESGPAAGVIMAARAAQSSGHPEALAFDMGGTTAKVGLVQRGMPAVRESFEIDSVNFRPGSGLPLDIPAVDLLEIGAGGGSIASVHAGTIQIGPRSAGSDPGPVCYGRGGVRPTVTDANALLGYLNPGKFAGGTMMLDVAAAETSIKDHVAAPLGLTSTEAAWGIHSVANSTMDRALRVMSVERGRDPREHVLVSFGGAGPVHAALLALRLGIPRVIVPAGAGVGSAVGLTVADKRFDVSVTRSLLVTESAMDVAREHLAQMRRRCAEQFSLDMHDHRVAWRYSTRMRYLGQGHEITVTIPGDPPDVRSAYHLREAFISAYAAIYGYRQPSPDIEIVHWMISATIPRGRGAGHRPNGLPQSAAVGQRRAYFPEADGFLDTPTWQIDHLHQGIDIEGPAIVDSVTTTVVIPPGCRGAIDHAGNLIIDIESAR